MSQSTILLNDFSALWDDVRDEALAAVDRVGRSGWFILGEEVNAFERALAAYAEVAFCVGVANGMDAIEIGLRCLGLQAGEKVLTTPLSAFATCLAIVRAGGRPVFVDTDSNGLLDLDAAHRYLAANRDVRFMVPVHLFGHALDMKKLKELRDEFSLLVVEDCAQSIGARSHDMLVGTVGQVAATSFYPTKNLGCLGDGGALLTSDPDLDLRARSLRDYGQSKKYVHEHIGLNSRLDELQAAILRSAILPRLPRFTQARREIAQTLCDRINNSRLRVIREPCSGFSVWHLFPIQVTDDRDAFQAYLRAEGITTGVHYPVVIPDQRALQHLEYEEEGFPKASAIASTELSLPIHPYLQLTEVERVIVACNAWKR